VLVDSSVWIDHLRRDEPGLRRLLELGRVATHPAVIGELACGTLRRRDQILEDLGRLPLVPECRTEEALQVIGTHRLWGRGLGWIDVLLLTSCRLARAELWTRDRPLLDAAVRLSVAYVT
jgi:predicted nucleic acid-binding protein